MKQIVTLIIFVLTFQLAYGQADGEYRIRYKGSITSKEIEIVRIFLPTTMFLHGIEKLDSKIAFIDTTLIGNNFDIEMFSHMTDPYINQNQLLTLYKSKSDKFIMKVTYLENNILKEKTIEIDWSDIEVSIIEDGNSVILFEFKIKNQII